MNRKIMTRIIALCLMGSGLWNIAIFFFWPLLTAYKADALQFLSLIWGIIYFRAGDNLFQLSTFGRKFVLGLLSVVGLWDIFLFILVLFTAQKQIFFSSALFGELSFIPGIYPMGQKLLMLSQISIIILAMAFLLQKETAKIFMAESKIDSAT